MQQRPLLVLVLSTLIVEAGFLFLQSGAPIPLVMDWKIGFFILIPLGLALLIWPSFDGFSGLRLLRHGWVGNGRRNDRSDTGKDSEGVAHDGQRNQRAFLFLLDCVRRTVVLGWPGTDASRIPPSQSSVPFLSGTGLTGRRIQLLSAISRFRYGISISTSREQQHRHSKQTCFYWIQTVAIMQKRVLDDVSPPRPQCSPSSAENSLVLFGRVYVQHVRIPDHIVGTRNRLVGEIKREIGKSPPRFVSVGDFFGYFNRSLSIADSGAKHWVLCEKCHGVGAWPSAEVQQCLRTS